MRVVIRLIVFLFLDENVCCGYSLEAPWRGASNEYPQHMFSLKNKKNIDTFWLKTNNNKKKMHACLGNTVNVQNFVYQLSDKMAYANSTDLDQTTDCSGSTLFAVPLHIFRNKCIKRIRFN